MNYIKKVTEMLGVKLNEEFKIRDVKYDKMVERSFCITKKGMFMIGGKTSFNSLLSSILTGEYEIVKLPKHKTPILSYWEREYLAGVIKPFRDKVRCIRKSKDEGSDNELIEIVFNADFCSINFPNFEAETMYRGMELGKEYFLEELGL